MKKYMLQITSIILTLICILLYAYNSYKGDYALIAPLILLIIALIVEIIEFKNLIKSNKQEG